MKTLSISEPFVLESGEVLPQLEISYHTFGQLNADGSNVVWVFHALTGNSNPNEWWPGIVGKNQLIDPQKDFIICANTLGSCYGSTGPASINPLTTEKYGADFPFISIRDMVQAHQLLQKHLGIKSIQLGIGGSMGGQQLIEWAISDSDLFENTCLLATNAQFSAWGIAFNESQRMAIHADLSSNPIGENAGKQGLKAARAIAMLSYRTYQTYGDSQQEQSDDVVANFKASSYQQYQGEKFWNRFDVYSYLCLTKAMDSHNIGRKRGDIKQVLARIKARTLIIGIQSDVLFPIGEQQLLMEHIPNAQLEIIDSPYGHDGFLVEVERISTLIQYFRNNKTIPLTAKKASNHHHRRSFVPTQIALPGSESF